jgi:hypothetical protein
MLALVGVFYPYNRGAFFTALVVIYALTSGIAGYSAASFYYMIDGKNWVKSNIIYRMYLWSSNIMQSLQSINEVIG